MLTAEQVQANNPGSRIFTAGGLSIVARCPFVQEWDLYVDMRRKKPAEARQLLRGCSILFPSRDDLSRLIQTKPFVARKLQDLVWGIVAPASGDLVESDKYPGAQMLVCDGVAYHLRQPEESECEKLEDGSNASYSAAATHFVKACLLDPDALAFDNANNAKPGLKHVLAAHLSKMAGADLEFTEKKSPNPSEMS